MQKRKLGSSDLEVAPLAFGGNVFGFTIDEKTSFILLDAFVEAGFKLIDTADGYSRWKPGNKGGESETIIGNWMKGRANRDKVIIATKVGTDMGDGKKGLSKKYIFSAVEDSLTRLQTDYIDLYQSHFDDMDTPVSETMDAYAALIKQGKVKYIGASNLSAARLLESLQYSEKNNLPKYISLQPEYNLYSRQKFEQEYQQLCIDNNLSVLTYFSLASGFLSGKYRSENDFTKSTRGSGMAKYLNDRGFKILAALDEISKRYNTSQSSVSIAWLLSQPTIAAPIASATNIEQLHALTSAANLHLDKDTVDALTKASAY
ncbi:MAG: aldo/keto reductase [Chitinophagaceae bacterium]|nr:aldo/keto reductase [Chitinophagaceae bacterium]